MRFAIIDIGYNAIRAVAYEDGRLGAPDIFSDKFRSDILSLLEMEELDVKHQTYLCFQYLLHIFKNLKVTHIKCVATAVLRGHPKAEAFKKIIKEKFNIEIDIISGEREAYLTAAGLISGVDYAKGLAADLGGGSLELAEISDKRVGRIKSLALGTKVISDKNISNVDTIKKIIIQEFGNSHYENLYVIGGALRFIGRYYMDFVNHPLKNLHNLEISHQDFKEYLIKLANVHNVKQTYLIKKIEYNAILVANAMLEVFKPEKIIVSNYGLKEGVRFDSLNISEQQKNIVYEKVKALIDFNEKTSNLEEYRKIVSKLLVAPDKVTLNIIDLGIMLSQFNKNIDKTLRANFAVEFILSSDIPFSHRQRLMLGIILSTTYNSKNDMYINRLAKRNLIKQDYANSQIIGNFIKMAIHIDGPEFYVPSFDIKITKDYYIEIDTDNILPRSVFEKVCEILKNIAFSRKI
jgi:exopolyphosphatase/guanosine-5'-triphosphate,3'-diphosphate pyrophosphatase